jgi:uncharacterized protein DUF6525
MSGNGRRGSYRTRRDLIWRAFDRLPPEVRQALADTHGNWVPQPLVTMMRQGASVESMLRRIGIWNRREAARVRKELKHQGDRP